MWKPTVPKISWPWRKPEPEGISDSRSEITPGARSVPAGVLVFDGENKDLWWVKVILNVGRPVVAVIVLVMCAPGEHYLARLAGWSHWLAWGMPATLTAYAGIAAVVATKRPKKSPGKKTAVAGAIISVLLAMGAQPIAHLYQRELITGHQFALTIVVSCIPALVFGHLLHMAAAPVGTTRAPDRIDHIAAAFEVPRELITDGMTEAEINHATEVSEPGPDAMRYRAGDEDGMDADLDYLRGQRIAGLPDTSVTFEGIFTGPTVDGQPVRYPTAQDAQDMINRPRPEFDVPDPAPDMWTARVGTPEPDPARPVPEHWRHSLADHVDNRDRLQEAVSASAIMSPDTDTPDRDNGPQDPRSVRPDVRPAVPSGVRPRTRGTGITGQVRTLLDETPDMTDNEIKAAFPDKNPDSVRKSINRVRKELEA